MGSEQIHYEALRKQIIMDRRDFLNIKKRVGFQRIFKFLNAYLIQLYFNLIFEETFATIPAFLFAL